MGIGRGDLLKVSSDNRGAYWRGGKEWVNREGSLTELLR